MYFYLLLYNVSEGEDRGIISIQTFSVSAWLDLQRLTIILLFPVTRNTHNPACLRFLSNHWEKIEI